MIISKDQKLPKVVEELKTVIPEIQWESVFTYSLYRLIAIALIG